MPGEVTAVSTIAATTSPFPPHVPPKFPSIPPSPYSPPLQLLHSLPTSRTVWPPLPPPPPLVPSIKSPDPPLAPSTRRPMGGAGRKERSASKLNNQAVSERTSVPIDSARHRQHSEWEPSPLTRWERRVAAGERPTLSRVSFDLLAIALLFAAPICGLLLLVLVAPLDVGRLRGTSTRADDLATGKLRPLLASVSKTTPHVSRLDEVRTVDLEGRRVPRRESDEYYLSASQQHTTSLQGRQSLIAAERLQQAEQSRHARQVYLLRVLLLIFPPAAQMLPRGYAAMLSSGGGSGSEEETDELLLTRSVSLPGLNYKASGTHANMYTLAQHAERTHHTHLRHRCLSPPLLLTAVAFHRLYFSPPPPQGRGKTCMHAMRELRASTPTSPTSPVLVGCSSSCSSSTPTCSCAVPPAGSGQHVSPRPTRRGVGGQSTLERLPEQYVATGLTERRKGTARPHALVIADDGAAASGGGMGGGMASGAAGSSICSGGGGGGDRQRDPSEPILVGCDGELVDEEEDGACILSPAARSALRAQLAPTYAIRDWVLRYSTEQHGCSLRTAYFKLGHAAGPTIIMVLDASGHRFGGFATEAWVPGSRYFGTGESFLFRAHPGPPTFYPWSGANAHFQLAYHDSIAMGGGGHFGLWLDEAFEYGSSGRSDTYDNAPLGSDESFRIIRVEVRPRTVSLASIALRIK